MSEAQVRHPYRWVILVLTMLSFTFTFTSRMAWPPLIPVMMPELGMDPTQAGKFMSAFYFGYLITLIPAGFLADRLGIKVILGGSMILSGIGTFFMGSITSYETGFACRVLVGLGAGAVYGSCARALVEWFEPAERGTAFGAMLAAPSGGILLANYIVPVLNQSYNWHVAFQVIGGAMIIFGAAMFFLLKTSSAAATGGKSFMDGLKFVFGHRGIMITAIAGFCLMWNLLSVATWANAYIKSLGFTVQQAGLVMMLYGIGGMIAPFCSGVISDKIGHRKGILILAYALLIPATIIFGQQTSLAALQVMGFVLGFISYIGNPQLTIVVSNFAGREWAGSANGASNFIFQLAPLVAPAMIGWNVKMTEGYQYVWYIMSAGPLLGIFLLSMLKLDEPARS